MATKKVKKFGAGGDILTGVGAVLVGKALYDKYKEGKGKDDEESDYARRVKEFGRKGKFPEEQAEEKAEPKEREISAGEKRATAASKGRPELIPEDADEAVMRSDNYPAAKSKPVAKPAVKKAAPAAPAKKAEPAAKPEKAASQSFPTSTAGKSSAELKSKPYPKDVKGTEKDPYLTSGGARNRAGMLVNPNFIAPKQASEEEVSEARASLAKRRAEQSRSFQESPLMKAISGGGSRADFYRKKREQEDAEKGMKKGGKVKKYASGGSVSSASKRADGIAQRGKTKGRIC